MIPAAIERNCPKRLLKAGWWHMSLFQQPAGEMGQHSPRGRIHCPAEVLGWLERQLLAGHSSLSPEALLPA